MTNHFMKSVVITGASTGIGRACALHLDRLGWRVFAGVRKESAFASLRAEASPGLVPILLDVTDRQSIKNAAKLVAEAVGPAGLSGLVNNAGVPLGGPIEFLDLDEVRAQFEVNVFGVLAVTQAFLPLLRLGRGRVVNISSISGLVAGPFVSPYSASKFALEAFSDSLRLEVRRWGIHVSLVEPGAIDTPIWDKAGIVVADLVRQASPETLELYGSAIESLRGRFAPHGIPVEEAAKVIARALTDAQPKARYPVGREGRIVSLFRRLPDGVRDWVIGRHLPRQE
jgi:NAD(P)-dependent dehydrogenase (short-subunit alcohol dehydrogenase family)